MKWKVGRSDEVWEHEAAVDSPNLQKANSGFYDPKNSLYESLAGKKNNNIEDAPNLLAHLLFFWKSSIEAFVVIY